MGFSGLEIGKRAAMVSQFGLDVTSNNIANVNTPGYSRQTMTAAETDPRYTSSGYVGTGAVAEKLRTFREEFFDSEIRKSQSTQASFASDEKILGNVEALLAEPTDDGMGEVVANFLNEFETLSTKPEDTAERDYVISLAQTTVDRFRSTAQNLADSRNAIKNTVVSGVDSANQLIKKVADLNKEIVTTNAQTGTSSQTYVDDRAQALEDLSKLVGISVTQGDNGAVNVFINGSNIITGTSYATLGTSETVTAGTGERTLNLVKNDNMGNQIAVLNPVGGEFSSELKHFNVTLDDKDSSGGLSVAKQLDTYAASLAEKVNSLLQGGYGLNDTGTTPSGRSLFEPLTGTVTASNISLNQDIVKDSSLLPIADTAGAPGNNTIAKKIARLSDDETFAEGQTPGKYYSTFLGRVGSMSKEATSGSTTAESVTTQLTSQREAVIGVNENEEAANLIKYQKSFEAAARIINTMDQILSTIVALGT